MFVITWFVITSYTINVLLFCIMLFFQYFIYRIYYFLNYFIYNIHPSTSLFNGILGTQIIYVPSQNILLMISSHDPSPNIDHHRKKTSIPSNKEVVMALFLNVFLIHLVLIICLLLHQLIEHHIVYQEMDLKQYFSSKHILLY